MSSVPEWANQQVPAHVLRTFPDVPVESWEWLSPMRLRGDHQIPGAAYLVVTADAVLAPSIRPQCIGQAMGPGYTDQAMAEVYGRLHENLMAGLSHELACQDGTPVRAPHDSDLCVWCGSGAADHRVQAGGSQP